MLRLDIARSLPELEVSPEAISSESVESVVNELSDPLRQDVKPRIENKISM